MWTAHLPDDLQQRLKEAAQLVYGRPDTNQALIEAIELWLANHRQDTLHSQQEANRQAYWQMKRDLAQNFAGKWFVIAHGKLQKTADSLEEVLDVAADAEHRIVMQVGEPAFVHPEREIELGWQTTFD